jgi:putative spermidine/putrescine transport system ATP-binding protein
VGGERPSRRGALDAVAESAVTALALAGIVRRFGAVAALDGVDLAVGGGEVLTLLGPSGSGKTTLLKVVAGFETPDAGTVALGGRDITALGPAKRGIGMVFQNYALFPHLTVAGNIAFPLEMRRLPRAEIAKKVAASLDLVGLAGYGERLPRQLSGGQQQRVALARAVVFDPGLLLLDEPFGALDRKLREQMQLEVRRLQRRLGITTLFVTHDQEEALVLSDRIAVMNRGRIEQIGTPPSIYARPANRFVADFVGESNLFRGRVERPGAGSVAVALAEGGRLRAAADGHAAGAEIGLVLRPERPRRLAPGEAAENRFDGVVTETVYVGESMKYRLKLEGGPELLVRWPFKAAEGALAVGDRVSVGWAASDMHAVAWS